MLGDKDVVSTRAKGPSDEAKKEVQAKVLAEVVKASKIWRAEIWKVDKRVKVVQKEKKIEENKGKESEGLLSPQDVVNGPSDDEEGRHERRIKMANAAERRREATQKEKKIEEDSKGKESEGLLLAKMMALTFVIVVSPLLLLVAFPVVLMLCVIDVIHSARIGKDKRTLVSKSLEKVGDIISYFLTSFHQVFVSAKKTVDKRYAQGKDDGNSKIEDKSGDKSRDEESIAPSHDSKFRGFRALGLYMVVLLFSVPASVLAVLSAPMVLGFMCFRAITGGFDAQDLQKKVNSATVEQQPADLRR